MRTQAKSFKVRCMRINILAYTILLIVFVSSSSCTKSTKITKRTSNFSSDQLALISDGASTAPMRVYKIKNYQDSILLRKKSQDVNLNLDDTTLSLFIDRLSSTVRDSMSMGVGIAAPQVGILKNIIWVQRFDKEEFPFEVYINPVIISYSADKQDCREGCLSIPDRSDTTTTRAQSIVIEYDDIDQSHHKETVEGFTAVIFQHEIDHLHGILYIDHLDQEIKESR